MTWIFQGVDLTNFSIVLDEKPSEWTITCPGETIHNLSFTVGDGAN